MNTVSGAGFWRHITQVANGNVNDYDYAFYPVINKGWPVNNVTPEVMNMMYYDVGQALFPTSYVGLDVREKNRIVPMPYLHYIVERAFAYVGWKVTGDIFNDATFLKATMINFRAINWATVTINGGVVSFTPKNPVEFDLKDHMPDISIPEFLISLKNRFGWWYDFNNTSKTCIIKLLKDIPNTAAKGFTSMANPQIEKKILQDKKIYALRNGIDPLDITKVDYQGMIGTPALLPAPAEVLYGKVYFVKNQNAYFICEQAADESWVWSIFEHNTFDFVPTGAKEDITTSSTVPDMEFWSSYLSLLPRIDNQGEWDGRNDDPASWGIHLALFHGLRPNITNTANYPYASTHVLDSRFNQVADWGLSYTCYDIPGDDVGIYETFWKAFLNLINSDEELTFVLYLPMTEYHKLKFQDRINIAGVEMFITEIKETLPYKGSVTVSSIRI